MQCPVGWERHLEESVRDYKRDFLETSAMLAQKADQEKITYELNSERVWVAGSKEMRYRAILIDPNDANLRIRALQNFAQDSKQLRSWAKSVLGGRSAQAKVEIYERREHLVSTVGVEDGENGEK